MKFSMHGKAHILQGLKQPEQDVEEEVSLGKNALNKGKGVWLQVMKVTSAVGKAKKIQKFKLFWMAL